MRSMPCLEPLCPFIYARLYSVLAWSSSDPNTVYCERDYWKTTGSEGQSESNSWVLTYVSSNAGLTWTRAGDLKITHQGRYDMALAVDPVNPSRVILANADSGISDDGLHSYRSPQAAAHVDHLRIVFAPSDPNIVYSANDGGIWRSPDRGENWTRFDSGVNTNLSFGFDTDTGSGKYYLSPGDYGSFQYDPATGWYLSSRGGEWGKFYIDPNDSATVWYASVGDLAVSHDRGTTWKAVDPDPGAPRPYRTVLRFHPTQKGTLFFLTDKIWVSRDSGATWTIAARSSNDGITDMIFDLAQPGTVYVSENGGILTSTDGGVTWTENKSSTFGLPYYCYQMAPVPGMAGNFYLTDNTALYLVSNGGRKSQLLSGVLFNNMNVNDLATDPAHPERVYVGTSLGLFFSQDYGQSWQRLGRNLPIINVWQISVKANTVYAGTSQSIWQFNSDVSWQPPSPSNLTASSISVSSITLTWTPGNGSTGVRIFRDGVQTYVGLDNSYTDKGLAPSTRYCYTTLDTNTTGEGPVSAPVCFNTTSAAVGTSSAVALSTNSLQFAFTLGGALPAGLPVGITNNGAGSMAWTASASVPWITVTPGSGTAPSTLAIIVTSSVASFAPGQYNGLVSVTGQGAASQSISVKLTANPFPDSGAVNAASNQPSLAPGALATIYGTNFASPAVVFSNLVGTNTPGGYVVGLYGGGPDYYSIGYNFTVPTGSDFIFTGGAYFASSSSGTNTVNLALRSDSGGTPGPVLESINLVNVLSSSPGIIRFNSASNPILVRGHQYWLTAAIANPSTSTSIWWISPSDSGLGASSRNDGSWSVSSTTNRGAFQILGAPKANALPVPTSLGGVNLSIGGHPSPLLYVSPSQINFQVPYEIVPGSSTLVITSNGVTGSPKGVSIVSTAPEVFVYGNNWAVIQNEDYSLNSLSNPAKAGSYVTLYGTGAGAVSPGVLTGDAAPNSPLSKITADVSASINGVSATVVFAGLTPGNVGLFQVNLQIPSLPSGTYPVQIIVGGATSNAPSIAVVQ